MLMAISNVSMAKDDSLYPVVDVSQTPEGSSCVRPKDEMRRIHPDLLKHDRINTMRLGIRGKDANHELDGSIKACVTCHAIKGDDGKYVRIDNEKHFCSSCHVYAGVSFDCFQCHRDIPEE